MTPTMLDSALLFNQPSSFRIYQGFLVKKNISFICVWGVLPLYILCPNSIRQRKFAANDTNQAFSKC